MSDRGKGFTLIELMIVVAVIGILAMVAVPKFAELIDKSREGATKGNLGSLRSAIQVYYSENEGAYPSDNLASLIPRHIESIPKAEVVPEYHPDTSSVATGSSTSAVTDSGGWAYNNTIGDNTWGAVTVNCAHEDKRGVLWTTY